MSDPIKLIHCTIGTGDGGGIVRMDTLYHRCLDRSRFDPRFVVMKAEDPAERPYDPAIDYTFTGDRHRWETLLRLFADADLVQFSGGFDPLACEAARLSGVPAVVEIMHLCEPGQLYPVIDATICVSQTVARHQPDPARCVVVPNGIDAGAWPLRDSLDPDPERIVLLESSRREKAKHFHLDELADDLLPLDPRIELWMAGRNHHGDSTGRVKFLGLRHDIADLNRQADLMVLLSKEEPFGLVALEAMASGALPVVADDGGMAEIVTHVVDGWLVPAHDRARVAETVAEALVMRGTPAWRAMQEAARRTVEERFSGAACVRGYEAVYDRLIARKGRRSAPGPVELPAPPDVLAADATFHYHAGRWDDVAAMASALAGHPDALGAQPCIRAAGSLAIQIAARGEGRTARNLLLAAARTGAIPPEWIRGWSAILQPDDPETPQVLDAAATLDPADPEPVLRLVEWHLNRGDAAAALQRLRRGVADSHGNADLAETLRLLETRLGDTTI